MGKERDAAVVVRRGTEADVEAWLDLLASVAAEGIWIGTEAPIDREVRRTRFIQQLNTDSAVRFVAVEEDRLVGEVGAVMGTGMDAGVADFGMFVARDSRGRGIGTALIEACLAWARDAGAHKVTLSVWPHNHTARVLYSKFGFVVEGTLRRATRRRNGELWDAILMGLVLDTTSPGRQDGKAVPADRAYPPRPSLDLPRGGLHRAGLLLRAGRLADAGPLAAAIEDPEVHRWLDVLPDPYTVGDARSFLADTCQQWSEGSGAHFLVTREGDVVGGIGLTLDAKNPGLGEVGYWVAGPARGRGIATTALAAVVDWAFTTVGLRRIELQSAVDNKASRSVAERTGFQQEGIKRQWRTVHGTPSDFVLYARVCGTSA